VNGVEYGSGTPATGTIDWDYISTNSLYMGKFSDNNDDYKFNGKIDEAHVSDIARTPEEIRQNYRSGSAIYGGRAQLADNEIIADGNTPALWHLNEGKGNVLHDSSGNGNDGIIYGATWKEGIMGNALEFDGVDDYVNCGEHSSLQITGDLTLECWAKYDTLGNQNNFISQGKGNLDGSPINNIIYQLSIQPDKRLRSFWEYGNGNNVPISSTVPADIESGEWHHYAMIRDTINQKITFFVDGVQLGEVVSYVDAPEGGSSTPLQIGGAWDFFNNDGASNVFDGIIDEVAVYNRTLSNSEIHAHANYFSPDATLRSSIIRVPDNHTFDTLHFERDVPQNTYLNISVHDAVSNDILYKDYNTTNEETFDLSNLDLSSHPTIYLEAYLQSSTTKTPILYDWSVNWTDKVEEPNLVYPELTQDVPQVISIVEDTPEENITDLGLYYNDIYSETQAPTYALQSISDQENMTLALNGSRLDVTYLAENWTGKVTVVANCTNMHGQSTPTNMFNITITGVNDAPVTELVYPLKEGVVPSTEVTLEWKAVDVDNAPGELLFDLYFGNNSTPPLKSENITETTTTVVDLTDGETYYWYVIARDKSLYGPCLNGTWNFTVDTNVAVPEADLHSPTDKAIINTTYANLSWTVLNETEGIIYIIYFGLNEENLHEIDVTVHKWYLVTDLQYNKTYYWKVIPETGPIQGRCVSGTWQFTVQKDFIPIYNITAELDVTYISIEQEQTAIFNVTLTNNGNIPTRVELAPSGIISGVLDMKGSVLVPINDTIIVTGTITDSASLTVKIHELPIEITYSNETLSLSLTINITAKELPSGDDDIEDDDDDSSDDGKDKGGILGVDLWVWIVIVLAIPLLFIVRYLIIRRRDAEDWDEEEEDEYEEEEEEDDEDEDDEEEALGGPSMGGPGVSDVSTDDVEEETEDVEVWGASAEEPEVWGAEEAPPEDSEAISPTIKKIIPGYTLVSKLGTGGFATVYKAIGPEGKEYAIKLPKFMDSTVDASVLTKFKEESDIWMKLKHKSVVTFYKGDIRPVPYMVIEYMEGGNLLEKLKKGKMPVNEAISLIMEILSGMAYAHRMASVHRDIKPENILFTMDGRPKISDWGIGKFMASESVSKTVGGKGTLAYSSPEQISPENFGDIDWSTDVFQLGIVFYEMLTGENPFMKDDPVTIMSRLVSHVPAPPSSIRPGIPPEMDSIILRALEKEKVRRFSSADSMFEKLKEAMKDRLENNAHYKDMLKAALADGIISPDEEVMLQGFRNRFKITEEDDQEMRRELMG